MSLVDTLQKKMFGGGKSDASSQPVPIDPASFQGVPVQGTDPVQMVQQGADPMQMMPQGDPTQMVPPEMLAGMQMPDIDPTQIQEAMKKAEEDQEITADELKQLIRQQELIIRDLESAQKHNRKTQQDVERAVKIVTLQHKDAKEAETENSQYLRRKNPPQIQQQLKRRAQDLANSLRSIEAARKQNEEGLKALAKNKKELELSLKSQKVMLKKNKDALTIAIRSEGQVKITKGEMKGGDDLGVGEQEPAVQGVPEPTAPSGFKIVSEEEMEAERRGEAVQEKDAYWD